MMAGEFGERQVGDPGWAHGNAADPLERLQTMGLWEQFCKSPQNSQILGELRVFCPRFHLPHCAGSEMSPAENGGSLSPRLIIVDGHSVIHAWEDLRRLHLKDGPRR